MPNPVQESTPSDQSNLFLQELSEVVAANLQNEQFSVEELANQMNMSRSNLHRKLKQNSGLTANQFIREYRLVRAMVLLKKDDRPISEVAYEVGFSSPSYFSSCFTEHYGKPTNSTKWKCPGSSASHNFTSFTMNRSFSNWWKPSDFQRIRHHKPLMPHGVPKIK